MNETIKPPSQTPEMVSSMPSQRERPTPAPIATTQTGQTAPTSENGIKQKITAVRKINKNLRDRKLLKFIFTLYSKTIKISNCLNAPSLKIYFFMLRWKEKSKIKLVCHPAFNAGSRIIQIWIPASAGITEINEKQHTSNNHSFVF